MTTPRFTRSVLAPAALALALALGTSGAGRAQAPQVGAASTSSRGKAVFETRCVECHGQAGKGDGPASFLLQPRPRDFTSGSFKIRSTESGTPPSDEDIARSIRQGLPGTAMPAWDTVLPDDDIRQVAAYVKTLAPRFAADRPQPVAVTPPVASTSQGIARGRQAYQKLQCAKCHGDDGQGTGAVQTVFQDDWKQPMAAANLTEPWTFRGGPAAADVFMRFRAGMSGTPMRSFKDAATDAEMWDLANYVASLARKPVWEMTADEAAAFYAAQDAEATRNPVTRGAYLVRTIGCAQCHTPLDAERRGMPGLTMAGGLRIHLEPFGDYPTGNLTSDKETGLGAWTDAEIKNVLTRGILRDGSRLLPYPMDWGAYSTMKASDLDAIVAYLRTIPPVRNKVPRPTRTFLPLYLWGKFKMLILGGDPPMTFFPGNVGVR